MAQKSIRLQVAFVLALFCLSISPAANSQEVIVLGGVENVMQWLKSEDWWGEENRSAQPKIPNVIITGINPSWRTTSQTLPVQQKKEVFYRLMVPLIVHANGMVIERRGRLLEMKAALAAGEDQAETNMQTLREGAVLLRILNSEQAATLNSDSMNLAEVIDEALYKLDIIPAGLALGQAAYESGYGTSRFAVEGNALFGQWTYGGKGLVPEQQRKNLGDHRIAAFDWPFDSVRGYFINLMSHPAYEDFRRLRAELRARGEPLTSMALADGLIKYSERGQEYVDTLKGIIRVNGLAIADDAVFRDEPIRFIVGAEDEAAAAVLREEVVRMRASGELTQIVDRMRLE
jgi:Bax protein